MSAKRKQNLLVVPRGVRVSPVGLEITVKLSYEQWTELMQGLQRAHRSILWLLGDALCWGEDAFGEKFSQVVSEYARQTQYNAQWVSRHVEISRRREILPWSHHAEVAMLEPAAQDRFLDAAERNVWGVRELREAVRLSKMIETPKPILDFHDEPERREVPVDYEEPGEQIISAERPDIEREFHHLLQLCTALRLAEKGNDDDDAARLRAALDVFISGYDQREKQGGIGGRKRRQKRTHGTENGC
jgi:hypothetical protein